MSQTENVIRENNIIQAFEILELFVELLHTRMQIIKMQKTIPFDLKEAISTIIYSAPRVDIPELDKVSEQFILKYGEAFANDSMENRGNCVNSKLVEKLSAFTPNKYVVFDCLGKIAEKYNVDFKCPYEKERSLIDDDTFNISSINNQPLLEPTKTNFYNNTNLNIVEDKNIRKYFSTNQSPPPLFQFDKDVILDFPSVPNSGNRTDNNDLDDISERLNRLRRKK